MKNIRISAVFFVAVTIWLCFTTFFEFGIKNILIDKMHMDNFLTDFCVTGNKAPSKVDINYEERYPFTIKKDDGEYDESAKKVSCVERLGYEKKIFEMRSIIEKYCTEYVIFREEYKAISGAFDILIGNKMVDSENAVITDEEGKKIVRSPFRLESNEEDIDISGFIEDYQYLMRLADNENIDILYVSTLNGENKYDTMLLECYGESSVNRKQDLLLTKLSEMGVETLDLREKYYEQGLVHKDAFFDTDNHMTPRAGLWASKEIAQKLNEECGFEFDLTLFDIENYEICSYPDSIYGAIGKSITLARAPYETTYIVSPIFDTDLHIVIESLGINKRGAFEDTVISQKILESKAILYEPAYNAYIYGKPAETNIINNDVETNKGKRILFLRDSFGQVIAPFIALGIEHTDLICDQSFNGNICDYIKQSKPDVIVIVYAEAHDPLNRGR